MGSRRFRPMTAADLASLPEPCARCTFWEASLTDLAAPADHLDRTALKADWARGGHPALGLLRRASPSRTTT